MDKNTVVRILEILRSFQTRKEVYLLPVNVDTTINFLHGFHLALFAMGIVVPQHCYEQAYRQRGWEYTARGIWNDMRQRDMDDEAIVDELIILEILTWSAML